MSTITVVLICHDSSELVREKLESLDAQTRKPDEVIVCVTGDTLVPKGVGVIRSEDRNDKGYYKRHLGGMAAKSEWVVFVNYDDWHDARFLELLMAKAPGMDVVFCGCTSGKYPGKGTAFVGFNSGAENWMVRTEVFREVGGYEHFLGDYTATNTGNPPDRLLIQRLQDRAIARVEECLVEIR